MGGRMQTLGVGLELEHFMPQTLMNSIGNHSDLFMEILSIHIPPSFPSLNEDSKVTLKQISREFM